MRAGGYHVTVGPPTPEDMAEVALLCQLTSAKHGNPGWYDPERLAQFGMELREYVRLVAIRHGDRIAAASISMVDGRRFHNWAAGTRGLDGFAFSPYQVMLHETVQAAIDNGCSLLEAGRRNDAWKERLGLTRQVLLGCLVPVHREQ
jgi:CelD/BcsL family acetyltransferase involved in cellulose biosynthesis